MSGQLSRLSADIATLRANWKTLAGGSGAAYQATCDLLDRRRVIVLTADADGRSVLCSRVRLIGDTQTDISRSWIASATRQDVAIVAARHFRAVQVETAGPAALLALVRVVTAIVTLAGGIAAIASTARTIYAEPLAASLHVLMADPVLWAGALSAGGFALLRRIVGWHLRRVFARGLGS